MNDNQDIPDGSVHVSFKFGQFVKEFVNTEVEMDEDWIYKQMPICKNNVNIENFTVKAIQHYNFFDLSKAAKLIDSNFTVEKNIRYFTDSGKLLDSGTDKQKKRICDYFNSSQKNIIIHVELFNVLFVKICGVKEMLVTFESNVDCNRKIRDMI